MVTQHNLGPGRLCLLYAAVILSTLLHIPLFISKRDLHASLSLMQPPYSYSFALLFFLFVLLLLFCLIFGFLAFSALIPFWVLFQPLTPLTAVYRSNVDSLKPKRELRGRVI